MRTDFEKVLFITNKLYLDDTQPEGGVKLCTRDFIKLLETRFKVEIFGLEFNRSVFFRFKAKLGIDIYEKYDAASYQTALAVVLKDKNIKKVFINLSSATALSETVKKINPKIKVILCSHGNESGDVLHQSVRFVNLISPIQLMFSSYRLGALMKKELYFRSKFIDLVLSVSQVEANIEKWLGAEATFMVPRVFSPETIAWNPIKGRVGFLADLSHYPNYNGLLQLCLALQQLGLNHNVEIRVVGMPARNLELLKQQFHFIVPLGYLSEDKLKEEASTWMYFLNLVFYYSKGVSTKLAKGMNWGLPVLSTEAGNRGYIFKDACIPTCSNAGEMARLVLERAFDRERAKKDRLEVLKAIEGFSDFNIVMAQLSPVLDKI